MELMSSVGYLKLQDSPFRRFSGIAIFRELEALSMKWLGLFWFLWIK